MLEVEVGDYAGLVRLAVDHLRRVQGRCPQKQACQDGDDVDLGAHERQRV